MLPAAPIRLGQGAVQHELDVVRAVRYPQIHPAQRRTRTTAPRFFETKNILIELHRAAQRPDDDSCVDHLRGNTASPEFWTDFLRIGASLAVLDELDGVSVRIFD